MPVIAHIKVAIMHMEDTKSYIVPRIVYIVPVTIHIEVVTAHIKDVIAHIVPVCHSWRLKQPT